MQGLSGAPGEILTLAITAVGQIGNPQHAFWSANFKEEVCFLSSVRLCAIIIMPYARVGVHCIVN